MSTKAASFLCGAFWVLGLGLSAVAGDSKELMRWYAVALSLLSIGIVLSRSIDKSVNAFSCYTVVILVPIWFLYLEAMFSNGDAWLLPADKVIQTLSYCAFFLMVFSISYRFTPPRAVVRFHEKHFLRLMKPALLPAVGITISSITVLVILIRYDFDLAYAASIYAKGRASGEGLIRRGGLGGIEVLLQPLDFMCSIVPTIAALSWVRFPQERKVGMFVKVLLVCFALLFMFMTFLSGTRSALAPYIAGPAVVWLLFGRKALPKVPFIVVTVLLFALLLGAWEFQKRKRVNLLEGVEGIGDIIDQTSFNITETHRDNNLYIFTLYNMYMPKPFPFEGFHEFYVNVVNPIPRFLWPGKPKSAHMLMSESLAKGRGVARTAPGPVTMGPMDITTFSLSQTIVGDGYKMYHYFGMTLYAVIMGFMASNWDSIGLRRLFTTKLYFILHAAWLFCMLWGFRSGFALITALYPVLGAYVLCIVAGKYGRPFVLEQPRQTVPSRRVQRFGPPGAAAASADGIG
jgi:hypothetical protein